MTRRVYNKVYSEDIWQRVNPSNKALLDDFILDLKENKKSPNTIRQYYTDLRGFFCHLYSKFDNKSVLELSRKEMKRYALSLLEERDLSSARRNGLVACLHSLLQYAELDDDYNYEINTSRVIRSIRKESVKDVLFINNNEVMKLYSTLMAHEQFQLATVLMLSYDSAGRRAELSQVIKESFLNSRVNNTNIVVGKGRKKFSLLYFDDTLKAANCWMNQRGEDSILNLFVIEGSLGKRVATPMDIYRMFTEMRQFINLGGKEANFSTHSMRHSSLANYKNGSHEVCKKLGISGFSIDQLKVLAHHDSVSTTQGYLPDTTNEELEQMFNIVIK